MKEALDKVTIDINDFGKLVRAVYKYGFHNGYFNTSSGDGDMYDQSLETALTYSMEVLRSEIKDAYRIKYQ